jgi:uncharacterized protein YdeI (YjbR/CyaY-like superfamily)
LPTLTAKRFRATLERGDARLGWVIIRVPFDVKKVWGSRGQIRVRGDINGFAFVTSLFPTGSGRHILLVNKRMQKGGRVVLGQAAKFSLQPDTAERILTIPSELKSFLDEDRAFRRWYDQLNPSTRHEISKWVTQVKSGAARERRAEQIAERLLAVMEAERELPPILQVAFARDERARAGWMKMSAAARRRHLFGIFYYRSPEARARRMAKALEEAVALMEKKSSREREA